MNILLVTDRLICGDRVSWFVARLCLPKIVTLKPDADDDDGKMPLPVLERCCGLRGAPCVVV